MTEIVIVILMLVLFVILAVITISSRKKETDNIKPNQPVQQYYQDGLLNNSDETAYDTYRSVNLYDKKKIDTFDRIIILIKNKFHPSSFKNDEECEKLLLSFLTENLPNNIITHGHTAKGDRLDIVIDGTYALELIVADKEEKLLHLMDLSLKSKKDFDKTAAIIIDIGHIQNDKIQEFTYEMKKIGIKTIVITVNFDIKKEVETKDNETLSMYSD